MTLIEAAEFGGRHTLDTAELPVEVGEIAVARAPGHHGHRPVRLRQQRAGPPDPQSRDIVMTPAAPENAELRRWRVKSREDREAPQGYAFPGDPRGWEQTQYDRAELTPLGRRILGLHDRQ